jgi:hypothetical protein
VEYVWQDDKVRLIALSFKSGRRTKKDSPFFFLFIDNDMINGTKLLNVTGMSRGKRDGILKNEKGRVVVKVGAMHLKGVW